jgi:hypothetical protein
MHAQLILPSLISSHFSKIINHNQTSDFFLCHEEDEDKCLDSRLWRLMTGDFMKIHLYESECGVGDKEVNCEI